jgi:Fe-Mn family superoxide dismutase
MDAMFTLPDLPYEFKALDPYLDERTMQLHHDFHHATYVKNLNDALVGHDDLLAMDIHELLQNLDKVPENVRTKVRNNGGGHANHSLFWTVMTPDSKDEPTGKLAEDIQNTFGDFKSFKEKMTASARDRFGSGWAWLSLDNGKLFVSDTPNQDTPVMEGKTPILGIDVWEHAYYLKYQNRRIDYIDAWWHVVNWKEVEKRYDDAHK